MALNHDFAIKSRLDGYNVESTLSRIMAVSEVIIVMLTEAIRTKCHPNSLWTRLSGRRALQIRSQIRLPSVHVSCQLSQIIKCFDTFSYHVQRRARKPTCNVDNKPLRSTSGSLVLQSLYKLRSYMRKTWMRGGYVVTFAARLWNKGRKALSCGAENAGFMTFLWRRWSSPVYVLPST